ncbi:MAG: UDP-diphosphatase [Desulfobacteraceae bacterium 4572_130]|nr:MAG: UDP-diphosphatase [Desulfobacteraceae bacterium 4572_130]
MEIYQVIILGVLQGLTEFLPISSSGHLVLGQKFFNITEPSLSFNISLHIGTLFAVIIVFLKDIKAIFLSLLNLAKNISLKKDFQNIIKQDQNIKLTGFIIIGSIPTALLGLFLKQYLYTICSSALVIGFMLIITGTFLWFTTKIKINIKELNFKKVLFIGFCQGIAVIPGISRSGITIAAGLFTGIDKKTAIKFSFLLSIPAIIGAEILTLRDSIETAFFINSATLYGTFVSFITGYFALKWLLKIVKKGHLYFFAPYCWVAGFIIFLLEIIKL